MHQNCLAQMKIFTYSDDKVEFENLMRPQESYIASQISAYDKSHDNINLFVGTTNGDLATHIGLETHVNLRLNTYVFC